MIKTFNEQRSKISFLCSSATSEILGLENLWIYEMWDSPATLSKNKASWNVASWGLV